MQRSTRIFVSLVILSSHYGFQAGLGSVWHLSRKERVTLKCKLAVVNIRVLIAREEHLCLINKNTQF